MDASVMRSKLKRLTPAQKGYIAGIFDGEGYLYVTEHAGHAFSRIRVRMTDLSVLRHLKIITGIGTISGYQPNQKRKDGGQKKHVFEWGLFKRVEVRDILRAVRPHLVLKRKHADVLLNFEHLKDQGAGHGYEVERARKAIAKLTTRSTARTQAVSSGKWVNF